VDYERVFPWLRVAACAVISMYLLVMFHLTTDLRDLRTVPPAHYVVLVLGVAIPLIPFVGRLRVGKLIELERDLRSAQGDLREFKRETREMISMVTTSVNSIGNLTATTNVNIGLTELGRSAKQQLARAEGPGDAAEIEETKKELYLEDEDTTIALARTRIRLEYLLRRILGKRTATEGPIADVKFMGITNLYRLFLERYPRYDYLQGVFEYVVRACNAAIHGQRVDYGQAQEVLDLGARLISTLDDIAATQSEPPRTSMPA
jgi:hypothetical protein